MGHGTWTTSSYSDYTTKSRGLSADEFAASKDFTAQTMYTSRHLPKELNPANITRECCDSDEHPDTFPVILALDVTGSMGGAAMKVAQKLNEIMTNLYEDNGVKDIEFCVMGIGDLAYDTAPIQISQFESDIRIAEQLDKVYFEAGGGGNKYESYTAAWYMGARHCSLDCWKRGKKGIIITMGDELPNPYLPRAQLTRVTGDKLQDDINTPDLLQEVKEKFNVYHISVKDRETSYTMYQEWYDEDSKWKELLGNNYYVASLDELAAVIVNIIKDNTLSITNSVEEVSW